MKAKRVMALALAASMAASLPVNVFADDAKEITLMASQNWIKDIDNELFTKFEEETGIKVKVSVTPDNEYKTLLGTTLAGGSDAVDMFMYHAGSEMESAGIPDVAEDLTGEEWAANLEDWAVAANTVDDKLLGFSTWGIDYEGVLYNKTFFEENSLEVPETWEGFMALCDQIKELGVMPLYEGINGTWHTQSWVYGLTPKMYEEKADFVEYLNESKDNKFADIACFTEGLTQLGEFLSAKDDNGEPKYYTNDGQAEDWFGSYTALQNREAAMMFTYSAYPAELAANGATDEFGMFPVPLLDNKAAVSNGGGVSKFINKNSEHIDECKQLLSFLAKDENLEAYYAARTDLVTASFKDVESVSATTATTDVLARSEEPKVMFIKDVLYWDTDVYKYLQGMAEGTMTAEDFVVKADEYRATMFDTIAE